MPVAAWEGRGWSLATEVVHTLLGEPLDGAGKCLSGLIEATRPVRELAGILPCESFSRLTLATRRSHGSLPQHVHRFSARPLEFPTRPPRPCA